MNRLLFLHKLRLLRGGIIAVSATALIGAASAGSALKHVDGTPDEIARAVTASHVLTKPTLASLTEYKLPSVKPKRTSGGCGPAAKCADPRLFAVDQERRSYTGEGWYKHGVLGSEVSKGRCGDLPCPSPTPTPTPKCSGPFCPKLELPDVGYSGIASRYKSMRDALSKGRCGDLPCPSPTPTPTPKCSGPFCPKMVMPDMKSYLESGDLSAYSALSGYIPRIPGGGR
jgi:hypothetical protein